MDYINNTNESEQREALRSPRKPFKRIAPPAPEEPRGAGLLRLDRHHSTVPERDAGLTRRSSVSGLHT
jgi:hypothetical protein